MTIDPSKLGWPVAAALAGVLAVSALSGFQGSTNLKFATVDTGKVFDGSPLATSNTELLRTANANRMSVLQFIDRNRGMEPVDAKKFADLSTKETPTPADKAEIERLRALGEAATASRTTLMTKNPPTDADRTALAEFGTKATANATLVQNLAGQYSGDIDTMRVELRTKTLARVREVVRTIGAKGGYTVVFDAEFAPYAANDITDEVSKALKK